MIDRLEMFLTLAREAHFGRAAEALGVTQPTLSGGLKALEDQLGVQLVFRGSRYRGLTPEGERVLVWARRIVADARAMSAEMRAARQGLGGQLRLGVIPTALPAVARVTGPFAQRHPGVRVVIRSCTSAEVLAGLADLSLDAGITYLDNEPLGPVARVPLYAEFYRLLCAASHRMAGRASVSWGEVAGEALCLLTADMQNRRIIDQLLAEAGVAAVPGIESNSTIALVAHVQTGEWVSVVPQGLAEMFTGGGRLVSVPIVAPEAEHVVGLVAARRDPPTPVVQALWEIAGRLRGPGQR
jgi:DNA-binding transcriptional LysR family regulator